VSARLPRDAHVALLKIPPPLALAAVLTLLFAVWFQAGWGGRTVIRYSDDLACTLAAGIGGWASWRASRRAPEPYRRSWLWIALGTLFWTVGDLVWVVVDLGTGKTPGLGYLAGLFPVLPAFACAALLRLPARGSEARHFRWFLDGALVALSGMLLLWNTVLQRVVEHHLSGPALLVAGALPLADVSVLTAVLLAGMYAKASAMRFRVLAVALGLLAVADMSFIYLTATRQYATGDFCDALYIGAFLTLAAAASLPERPSTTAKQTLALPSSVRQILPYIPFGIAASVAVTRRILGHLLGSTGLVLWTAITILILLRQYLTLLDNRYLLREVRGQQRRLAESALTDPVTGLGNRLLFAERVSHALALHARDGRPVSLCWLDVDDFKVINDTYGHAAGDDVLIRLAARLRGTLRAGDTIARLGGDEFGVLLEDGAQARDVAAKLLTATDGEFEVAGNRIRIPTTIGVATLHLGDVPTSAEELMARADIAMYAAKALGKNRIATFQAGMTMPGTEDFALRDGLRAAVAMGSIEVYYQPVVEAESGRLHGFEALARWFVDGSSVAPERFIVLADRLGLGCQLGQHVFEASIRQLAAWSRARGDDRLVMSVNLSPEQLLDRRLPERVAATLARHGISGHQVALEITERALLTDNANAMEVAGELTALGVRLALDDFGTGYSSLAHLRGFPLATVKLDRSFVADIDTDEEAHHFLRALIRLGMNLGLQLVAEGVERPAQLEILRALHCRYVQGYLVSRPGPAAAFDAWVTSFSGLRRWATAARHAERDSATSLRLDG
jgi:diguanylate cyclase (GGDEF)-like protein